MNLEPHLLWAYAHIVLFVYWLGADVGLYLVMVFVKNPRLGYETRATLIRLAFYIDQFPRITFALILPVGMHLARDLGLYPIPGLADGPGVDRRPPLERAAPRGGEVQGHHLCAPPAAGSTSSTSSARRLLHRRRRPVARHRRADRGGWFALKLLLFGLIFWVILGIDLVFQPFTMILRMGPGGSTPEKERR